MLQNDNKKVSICLKKASSLIAKVSAMVEKDLNAMGISVSKY